MSRGDSVAYLQGPPSAIASLASALEMGPPLPHTCQDRDTNSTRICKIPWCVFCLSFDFQKNVQPQWCYQCPSLKHAALLSVSLHIVAQKPDQDASSVTSLNVPDDRKVEVANMVHSLIQWQKCHHCILGKVTTCLQSRLFWKSTSQVDFERTALKVIKNPALPPDVRWPIASAYENQEAADLWTQLHPLLKQYWTDNWKIITQFRKEIKVMRDEVN